MTLKSFLQLIKELEIKEEIEVSAPCDNSSIESIENELKIKLPNELAEFLSETNGLRFNYSLSIWSVEEIINLNKEYWFDFHHLADVYMPFNNLLFFADGGNGDLFAYRILQNQIEYHDIYKWDHETDSRIWVASNLLDFVRRSVKNELD